jgi:diguanylate cyclase (GGDEF)-like protein
MENEQELALLLIDADFFKRYNDHFGHVMGDECLQALAEVISGATTVPDAFVSRFGGEEFAVILPQTGLPQARLVAEQIRAAVMEMGLPHPETQSGFQTVSIGVAAFGPEGRGAGADLVGRADMALYRAKDFGRNRVVAA